MGDGNYALLDAGGRTVSSGYVTTTGSSTSYPIVGTYPLEGTYVVPTVTIYPDRGWWDYGNGLGGLVPVPSTRVEPRLIPWEGTVVFPPLEAEPAVASPAPVDEDRFLVELPGKRVIELD